MPLAKPENWTWDGLTRSNILKLQPYRCARDDYDAGTGILLDANENSLGHAITAKDHEIGFALEELKLNRCASAKILHDELRFALADTLIHHTTLSNQSSLAFEDCSTALLACFWALVQMKR